jgi:regulator of protease activity HflC (stomatin/prohibitin superfamily)
MSEVQNIETNEKAQESTQEKTQEIENLKYRIERAEKNKEKEILSELGAESFENVKKKLESVANYEKQVIELKGKIAKAETLKYKVEVLQSGFDDKFVDFVIHELQGKVSEKENFSEILKKFKEENPQYLKNQDKGIKFNTAPSFGGAKTYQSASEIINHLIRGDE